jgi:hypothetical protein
MRLYIMTHASNELCREIGQKVEIKLPHPPPAGVCHYSDEVDCDY